MSIREPRATANLAELYDEGVMPWPNVVVECFSNVASPSV